MSSKTIVLHGDPELIDAIAGMQNIIDANTVVVGRLTEENELLKARVAELEVALRACSKECDHLHHEPKDRHSALELCPVESRMRRLLSEGKE